MARPGGNVTGFMNAEYSQSGKWLELLKEISPGLRRVAVLRDPTNPAGGAIFGVIQTAAQSLRIEANVLNIRDAGEIERAVATFAQTSNSGLIVTAGGLAIAHRDLIVALAARHKLPAVYFDRSFVAAGAPMRSVASPTCTASPPTSRSGASRRRSRYVIPQSGAGMSRSDVR